MSKFKNLFISLHDIDRTAENDEAEDVKKGVETKEEVKGYVYDIIENSLKAEKSRQFEKRSDDTEVIANILKIFNGISESERKKYQGEIASRLLRIEKEVHDKHVQFTKLKKGVLLQAYVELDGTPIYFLAKIEHIAFLEEKAWVKRIGLPFEQQILKTCLIKFKKNPGIDSIVLYDTNQTIANYWWNQFLELKEKKSDAQNARKSLVHLKKTLSRNLEEEACEHYKKLIEKAEEDYTPDDKADKEFDYEKMVDTLIDKHDFKNTKIDKQKLKESAKKPAGERFDKIITIKAQRLEVRKGNTFKLHEQIKLVLKDQISNLRYIIEPVIEPGGGTYLKIKVRRRVYDQIMSEISKKVKKKAKKGAKKETKKKGV